MRPRGDEIPGRSQVVDGTLSAMTEANLAQMLDSFTSDSVVDFTPDGLADETQAELETDVCTQIIMRENDGWLLMAQSIKDALLQRNGLIKIWLEDRVTTRRRTYRDVTPESYAELALDNEVLEWSDGELTVRERRRVKRLRLEATPIENFMYTKNWHSLDLQEIPFCGERHTDRRGKLVEMFPDKKSKINDLPAYTLDRESNSARNPARRSGGNDNRTDDASLDLIEWIEGFALIDVNGDGIGERHRVSFVEDQCVLEKIATPFVDYAAGSVLINPHRFLGVSLHDKLKQVQDVNTGLLRALLDNAAVANKSRTIYLDRKVDTADLADGAPNANVAVKGVDDVRKAVAAHVQPDISGGIKANIETMKRNRAELGGAALDMSQANMQLSDRAGSQGIDRAYSVIEQLASMMMRTIAESLIKNVYLLTHAKLRYHFDEELSFRTQSSWITANPAEWQERTRASVRLGLSPGQRTRRRAALGQVIEWQAGLADKGYNKILVEIDTFYSALMDWCRSAELDNPEQYFIDPRTDESKQAVMERQAKAEQQQAAQQKLTDLALGLEQLRIAIDKHGGDADRALSWRVEQLKAAVEEMKVVGKATEALELQANERADTDAKQGGDEAILARIETLTAELKGMEDGGTVN